MKTRLAFLVALGAFAWLFVANAWVGDDAYITFRTVDNFVHGHGMRWNVHERVQVFTHPLWMLLCSLVYFFTREFYYSVVVLSFAVCLAGFLAYWWILGRDEKWKAVASVAVLTTSKTFMDFSSSGLENCLGAFWAVLFILAWWDRSSPHTIWRCVLIAAAAYITRQDTVLLYVYACVYLVATRRAQTPGWVRQVIAGATPALAWTIFSIVYFGFPFPNTAYGKTLVAGIPFDLRLEYGLRYFTYTARWDLVAVLVAVLGVTVALRRKPADVGPILCGIAIHAVYVVFAGAASSPMALRFLSVPLVLMILVLLMTLKRAEGAALVAASLAIAALLPTSPWRTVGCAWAFLNPTTSLYILDTRAAICRDGGALFNARRGDPAGRHIWMRAGREFRTSPERVRLSGPYGAPAMGYFGFAAGPDKIIVDPLGVTDPLMARLPARLSGLWIPGHLERRVPEGYLESLATGENRLAEPGVRAYYDSLRTITSGPVFSFTRWREIVAMSLGRRKHLLQAYSSSIETSKVTK